MSASDLRLSARALGLTAALVASAQALAQNPPVITDADIERVRREQPAITDQDIDAARRKYSMPVDAELRYAPVPPPNVEALPQPLSRTPIDLEALARGYASQADAMTQAQGLATGPGLLVFVSLSMPRPTLQRLVGQAARAKASIVLRGFANGSLRDTVAQVQGLIGTRELSVQIDPQAFDRFSIVRTPSFVLVRDGAASKPCAAGMCIASDQFVLAAGDVSLDYALRFFERSAPGMARDASSYLQRMKGAVR